MSRKPRVRYTLSDLKDQTAPSNEDIEKILRAADEIIFTAGRSMLAKILKGSKDKKLLENHLDSCPSYGYYKDLTLEKITKVVDWMLANDYLDINYNGRFPMIIFSQRGWETYKPVYVEELYNCISNANIDEAKQDELVERLKGTNREVIKRLLLKIGESKNIGVINFLRKWESSEVKKVRHMISDSISKLENS
ncbi:MULTISPECIES: RQC domain-containing protein [Clostridium]|uniref:RQC domain-containing protein n=1 Tax=Clostridium TaxID=1485 RepID=UPI000826DBA4|nr:MULTISPECIES: RQC-minor-1 family DNA-binding protein [Clostridium]PJI10271.1 DNA helicase II [Clostridium sp. CT7]